MVASPLIMNLGCEAGDEKDGGLAGWSEAGSGAAGDCAVSAVPEAG